MTNKDIVLLKLGQIFADKVYDVDTSTYIHMEFMGQSEITVSDFKKLSDLARDFKLTVNIYPIPPNKLGLIVDTKE